MKEYDEHNNIAGNNDEENNLQDPMYLSEDKSIFGKEITDSVWAVIIQICTSYQSDREKGNLILTDIVDLKKNIAQFLNGRIDVLRYQGRIESNEAKECIFLNNALVNGWTIGDLDMLSSLFELYIKTENPQDKKSLETILTEIDSTKIEKLDERFNVLNNTATVLHNLQNRKTPSVEEVDKKLNDALSAKIMYNEYTEDEEYNDFYKKEGLLISNQQSGKGKPANNYNMLLEVARFQSILPDEERQSVRLKEDYIMERLKDDELEKFDIHLGHKHNNIYKSTRRALKEVFGCEIYDDIDEMHRGSKEDRKVKIHHSTGTNQVKKGEYVLEIDFAGSGFQQARKEHHSQHGKAFKNKVKNTEQSIKNEFGELVKKKDGTPYKHLREKKTRVIRDDGKKVYKKRYSIAGPSPDLWFKPGALNIGEYSIDNTREYGKDFASDFIVDLFKKWESGIEKPNFINLDITGHSRGAVAAGESIKLIDEWLKTYVKDNPHYQKYEKYVRYNLILRDPVPGFITKWFHSKNDLRGVKNLNTTLFCSMAQEHSDVAFPLQYVRGAKRIIIGATEHGMELGNIDTSQMNQIGDSQAHQAGFYDAETGEYFRRSGLNELPDGVYIADDRFNLIRVTSYSQIGKVIGAVYGENSQQGRVNTIHKMVRDWFLDNNLQMSFPSEEIRNIESKKNDIIMRKILMSDNKRISGVRKAVEDMTRLKTKEGVTNEEILRQNNEIIKACRAYMEKTSLPPSAGDSEYRMNLVSDLLSFNMKEKNYHELEIQRKVDSDAKNEMDEKINAHQDRLRRKEGALERKIASQNSRRTRDRAINSNMKKTAKACEKELEKLKLTRVGKKQSGVYKRYIKTLEKASQMDENTSINSFREIVIDLKNTGYSYIMANNGIIGPVTKDGQTRLKSAFDSMFLGEEMEHYIEAKSLFIGDKDVPIGDMLNNRMVDIMNMINAKDEKDGNKRENEQINVQKQHKKETIIKK